MARSENSVFRGLRDQSGRDWEQICLKKPKENAEENALKKKLKIFYFEIKYLAELIMQIPERKMFNI